MTEMLTSRLGLFLALSTSISSVAGFVFWSIGFMDSRHASAADMDKMARTMKASQIERVEYQIAAAQRKKTRLVQIPEEERTRQEVGDIEDLKYEIEFRQRELKRIEGE